jgi:anthranilate synthase/aminodeoxychorismate synthase-like glutamine amidotransferase
MLLLIDNYDSFTYNLYQYLAELGADMLVRRNDELTVDEAEALTPTHLVISPGPCTPREAGISTALIARLGPRVPTLGVCLGHQCIGEAFGGRVVRAREPVHGKTSRIHHRGQGVLRGLPSPFEAARYHSLIVARARAARAGGDRRDGGRRDHGAAPPRVSRRGRAVSPRVDPDARR